MQKVTFHMVNRYALQNEGSPSTDLCNPIFRNDIYSLFSVSLMILLQIFQQGNGTIVPKLGFFPFKNLISS